jgi:nucleoid-associated protein Lsr2
MARRIVKELIDDIDGSSADEMIAFGLDGIAYEIDLSQKNAAGLREAFAKYVGAGRRRGRRSRTPSKVTRVASDSRTIREWAQANNVSVPAKGRVPASVVAQFNQAHRG